MACNIIKEIDSLGRIVLPKDIRKSLDLNCGDKINLSIDEDKVYLTKLNKEKQLKSIGDKIGDSIYEGCSCACIITDDKKVISCAGLSQKIVNKSIEIVKNSIIVEDKEFKFFKIIYSDIVVNSCSVGKIILLIKNSTENSFDYIVDSFCRFLGKYLDE